MREEMLGAQWVEGHELLFAMLTQRLVQVELMRFWGECGVLQDFYYRAANELLPEEQPPVPRIDVLDPDYQPPTQQEEPKKEEKDDKKGKGKKDDKKGKEPAAAVEHAGDDNADNARKPRVIIPAQLDPDSGEVVTPEHVAYPLLDMLCEAATGAVAALAKPRPWPPGAAEDEAAAPADAAEKKKTAKDDKKAKDAAAAPADEPTAPEKPMPHAWVDYHQALRSLEVRFAFRLQTVRRWAESSLDWLADDAAKLRESLEHMCLLEARAERQAIDAFVNEVGLHVEREDKFACVLSLHGSQLRTHPNLLLDAPAIPLPPVLRETPVPGRPSLAQLEAALAAVCAVASGGELSLREVESLRPALWPGSAPPALAQPAVAARRKLQHTAPRSETTALELLLSLALVRPEDWLTEAEVTAVWQEQLTAPGRDDVWVTEVEFASLPLFERMADPSGFPRAEGFRSWLFRLFATYPVKDPGTPEPAVSLRRVLSMLALQTTVAESLRVAFTMMGYADTGELEVTSLHEFLLMPAHWTPRPAAVPEPEPLLQVEEVVHAFRDIITPSGAQAVTIAEHNVDVVVESAIATGRIEAGMQAVLSHPNVAALPLEHRWTRPQFF